MRKKHSALLLIILLSASILWLGIIAQPAKNEVAWATTDIATSHRFIDLAYLTAHFQELRGVFVSTIGVARFSPSIYMYEDFWLKGANAIAVPVVMSTNDLPRPKDGSLVEVSGKVEFSSLEGGSFYLNASSAIAKRNVILLGWDGVQRNHLLELIDRGSMPNLVSFMRSGTMVNVTISDHYTDTKAGWTQILTGYKFWKTGVYNNFFWFHSIPAGYTIPERVESIFGEDQVTTGFIAGKLRHMETVNSTGSAVSEGPFTHEAIYSNLPSRLDVVSIGDNDQDRYANVVGPMTLQFIENNTNNHFFAFFHFSDPDHIGHAYGENSVEYENAIETCDYWLGQVQAKLNTLGIAQNTLIYVTADHGFDEGETSHYNSPYIFLAASDKNVSRNGDQVDVAPTIYYGLGLWNQTFSPALDGYPLQVALPSGELQYRQEILANNVPISRPSMSIANSEMDQMKKIVTFQASDNNSAVIMLLVDNTLKADGLWTRNHTATTSINGSYTIDTRGLSQGWHNVKILAFGEHGTNNGGPGNQPENDGGSPSINSLDLYVGTLPPPSPSPSPIETPTPITLFATPQSPLFSPSFPPSPNSTASQSLVPSPSPSQSPSPFLVALTGLFINLLRQIPLISSLRQYFRARHFLCQLLSHQMIRSYHNRQDPRMLQCLQITFILLWLFWQLC